MHALPAVLLLALAADSSSTRDPALLLGPYIMIASSTDPVSADVDRGWGGGALGLWRTRAPWLSIRGEIGVLQVRSKLTTFRGLDFFGDTLTDQARVANNLIWLGVGPQIETRAGPATLFGFATSGIAHLSSGTTGGLGAIALAPEPHSAATTGLGWSAGAGARARLTRAGKIWVSVEYEAAGRTRATYVESPPFVADPSGLSRAVFRRGRWTTRQLRLSVSTNP
jgi:hypothetical protein